jgi:UDP-N-acetylglucosamine 2-epimerase (non-hydrolysing)
MPTVLSIFGTRPEAIKMAPVVKELQRRSGQIRSLVCVTGQHREMLDQVLKMFAIQPDYDLNLMQPNQTLAGLTAVLFEGLDRVVRETRPDWILAQGDTTTVMVASLVSHYHRVRFGHVEAGLRTGDKFQPFPEEMNRRIADLLADAYFAPTERSKQALLREGADPELVHVTGNTVIDALMDVVARPFDWGRSRWAGLPPDGRLVLITAHRRESFGQPFRELCEAIRELAGRHQKVWFVYPVHLNPNVRQPVGEILADLGNVSLIEPVDYFEMVHLMKRSVLILTDSGGVQEEAPSLNVPVLVLRDTTERPEGVEAGVVRLVGTKKDRIVEEADRILEHGSFVPPAQRGKSPYGDGKAAQRIVTVLLNGKMS